MNHLLTISNIRDILRGGGGGGGGGPPKKSWILPQTLKIAKFWGGGSFSPQINNNINIKLVSGKAYNLEYKNG
jgi:hypothetical protein